METIGWALLAFLVGVFCGAYVEEILRAISNLFGGRGGH